MRIAVYVRCRLLAVALCSVAMLQPDAHGSQVLWSTGIPQAATLESNGLTTERYVWQYSSGYVDANSPKRVPAIPLRLAQDATITEIRALYSDAHPDTGVRTNPTDVSFIVWSRTGLAAPTSIVAEGSFGPYALGTKYEGGDVNYDNDFTHNHAVNVSLLAGDYYLSLYSKDTTINWVTGGQQPDAALEQAFMWRSRNLPAPGFEQYIFPSATPLLSDGKDIYNPIFSIVGVPVPEPEGVVLLTLATVFGIMVRRPLSPSHLSGKIVNASMYSELSDRGGSVLRPRSSNSLHRFCRNVSQALMDALGDP